MKYAELHALAVSAGFSVEGADIAAAVALAESGGDPFAQGDPHGNSGPLPNGSSSSFGLWQINHPAHPEYEPHKLLTDLDYAARAAFAISKHGTDWEPWTTYRDGAYRKFLPHVVRAGVRGKTVVARPRAAPHEPAPELPENERAPAVVEGEDEAPAPDAEPETKP